MLVVVLLPLPLGQIKQWTTDEASAHDHNEAVFTVWSMKKVATRETLLYAKGVCTPT